MLLKLRQKSPVTRVRGRFVHNGQGRNSRALASPFQRFQQAGAVGSRHLGISHKNIEWLSLHQGNRFGRRVRRRHIGTLGHKDGLQELSLRSLITDNQKAQPSQTSHFNILDTLFVPGPDRNAKESWTS